jgi:hypothetical protein
MSDMGVSARGKDRGHKEDASAKSVSGKSRASRTRDSERKADKSDANAERNSSGEGLSVVLPRKERGLDIDVESVIFSLENLHDAARSLKKDPPASIPLRLESLYSSCMSLLVLVANSLSLDWLKGNSADFEGEMHSRLLGYVEDVRRSVESERRECEIIKEKNRIPSASAASSYSRLPPVAATLIQTLADYMERRTAVFLSADAEEARICGTSVKNAISQCLESEAYTRIRMKEIASEWKENRASLLRQEFGKDRASILLILNEQRKIWSELEAQFHRDASTLGLDLQSRISPPSLGDPPEDDAQGLISILSQVHRVRREMDHWTQVWKLNASTLEAMSSSTPLGEIEEKLTSLDLRAEEQDREARDAELEYQSLLRQLAREEGYKQKRLADYRTTEARGMETDAVLGTLEMSRDHQAEIRERLEGAKTRVKEFEALASDARKQKEKMEGERRRAVASRVAASLPRYESACTSVRETLGEIESIIGAMRMKMSLMDDTLKAGLEEMRETLFREMKSSFLDGLERSYLTCVKERDEHKTRAKLRISEIDSKCSLVLQELVTLFPTQSSRGHEVMECLTSMQASAFLSMAESAVESAHKFVHILFP